MRPKVKRPSFENTLFKLILLAGIPAGVLALFSLSRLGLSPAVLALLGLFLFGKIFYIAFYCKRHSSYQLRTLSNLLEALSNGDYSLRGRISGGANPKNDEAQIEDAYSELVVQINLLADTLMSQRLEAKESQLLLAKVMNNIAIGLVAVNSSDRIVHVNKAFCQLFGESEEALLNASIDAVGKESRSIRDLFLCNTDLPQECHFVNKSGRFSVYRDTFIEDGKYHQLLLLTDVKLMLRSEEQMAWQKLIRVIGHEINNSLSPISSLSASLQKMAGDPNKVDIMKQSLGVIHQRSLGLVKLVSGYKELARTPTPKLVPLDLVVLAQKLCALYPEANIVFSAQAEQWWVDADAVLIEQVLINLLKNAQEAQAAKYPGIGPSAQPAITLAFARKNAMVILSVLDHGTGISNLSNVFVPFYSTKPNGSGIGLALSRQIIEAHGGELNIMNRTDTEGVCAQLELRATSKRLA